jgi:hypothetical protein
MNLPAVLRTIRPGDEWSLNGNDYAGLTWLSATEKPTEQECLDAWPFVEVDVYNEEQQRLRAQAYAAEADPLFFYWQADEGSRDAWDDKRNEIRLRYPYREYPPEE